MQGVLIVHVLTLRQYNYGPITKALPSTVPRVETKGQDVFTTVEIRQNKDIPLWLNGTGLQEFSHFVLSLE